MLRDIPVIRNPYIVTAVSEYDNYLLQPLNGHESINVTLEFFSIKKPGVGDVLELPDSMIFHYEDGRMIRNHMLSFGKPVPKPTEALFPKDFNIQEDYAYIVYEKPKERILIQRVYG